MLNAGATEEWLIFDTQETNHGNYHNVYRREMQEWLRRAYRDDVQSLQRAWNDPRVTFETAAPPAGMVRSGSHIWGAYTLRDPRWDRPAIDYYRFLNETLANQNHPQAVAFRRTTAAHFSPGRITISSTTLPPVTYCLHPVGG